jgi:hypothetical protein
MIIFNGVEIPSNRTLLEKCDVQHVMISYWGLRKRGLPKTKAYLIGEHFFPNMKVWVDSGATSADEANLSKAELLEYAADYEEFVSNNHDRIEGWVEFDSQVLGLEWIEEQRYAQGIDPKRWVVWREKYGTPKLQKWSTEFENIAIPYQTIESMTSLSGIIRGLKSRSNVEFHALATAKPDNLRQIPFSTTSTLSWISPMRRGETIIWDGQKLVRYPKNMKAQARPRYKALLEKEGFDFQKFIDDDTLEATKVAVWSYKKLESSMQKGKNMSQLADSNDDPLYTGLMQTGVGASNNSGSEVLKQEATEVVARDPKDISPLPVFGYQMKTIVETENGHDVLKEVPVVQSQSASLRHCNTCFVAANCPAFKPDNACAFNLPVEVKTKEQLKSLLTTIIEMQGQRVAFMRFAEEMNGGYADPNVSQEVDRLFKLVKSMKELDENKEFIQITASRQSSGGVLSAIFGDRAQVLKEMHQPLNEEETTTIIKNSLEN